VNETCQSDASMRHVNETHQRDMLTSANDKVKLAMLLITTLLSSHTGVWQKRSGYVK
jgi:hypothetical protein